MAGQSVFKGALGWDDWIWWTAIGGLALFLFLMLLCCCVCVQRAKRKGRQEALAAVQARQREEQQREEAQVRYAQAQQARYPPPGPTPAQEQSYKFSQQQGGSPAGAPAQFVPAGGPKKNYGPQVRANAGYAVPPPLPPQQQQAYGQPQQHQAYGQSPVQHYGAMPAQQYSQSPQQQYGALPPQKQQQQPNYYNQQQVPPQYAAQAVGAQRNSYTQEPSKANPNLNYERKAYNKPKPWHANATPEAPYVVPAAAAVDKSFLSTYSEEGNRSLHEADEVPFVAVTSPGGRDSSLNASKLGMTLRDRIDALREGSVHENHTRISVDPQDLEPPPVGAGRRSLVLVGTVLSEKSDTSSPSSPNSPDRKKKEPQPQFKTARSSDGDYSSSEFSSAMSSQAYTAGQFDDAETFAYKGPTTATTGGAASAAARERFQSGESTSSRGSVEF